MSGVVAIYVREYIIWCRSFKRELGEGEDKSDDEDENTHRQKVIN